MKVDSDQKQARNTQETTNWQRENNDAGNNLAWHAASATGSRTYMGPHQTGDPSSYIQKTCSGITPDSQIMKGNVITPDLNTCRQSLHLLKNIIAHDILTRTYQYNVHRVLSQTGQTTRIYRTSGQVSAEKKTQLQNM